MSAPRFGMVQGRLIQSPPGHLQWFPQDYWEGEFYIAPAVGIDFIELIAETHHNPNNPIWSESGVARIKELVARNGLTLPTLCNDYIVAHALVGDPTVLEQNFALLERGRLLGCDRYILPFFEASEINTANQGDFVAPLRAIADHAAERGILVLLETILTGAELVDFLDLLDHPNVAVVYDSGNRVAFGHDLAADIRLLGPRIRHFHVKDKNASNQNVLLGTGLVNFRTVFQALRDIGYQGLYTFETFRGHDPLRTARHNLALINFFMAEAADDPA